MAISQVQILQAVQSELASITSGSPAFIPYFVSLNIAQMLADYAVSQGDATYRSQIISLAGQAPKCESPLLLSTSCASEHSAWLVKVQTLLQSQPSIFASFDIGSWLAVGLLGVGALFAIKKLLKRKQ